MMPMRPRCDKGCGVGPKNRVHRARRGWNELPIFLQNALILTAGETGGALRVMRNQTTNFWNSAAPFLRDEQEND